MHYENVSEKEPISADEGGRLTLKLINGQYSTIKTLNTKTRNIKEKVHEFNFKAAKNK
jgi:hypothetical protein